MSGSVQNSSGSETKTHDFRVSDVVMLTARLAQLLAEEVDLLGDMKVKKIEALQQEKIFLTNALEAQRKLIEKNPYIIDTIPSRDKKDFEEVAKVFENILAENHRKLLLAKEINHKVVRAITDVVKETTLSRTYNINGTTGAAAFNNLSVTLNKTI
jgi:hypothetical protein